MWKSIKRLLMALNLWAEKASETDALNAATVEIEIRKQKAAADKAHYANGQLQANVMLLKNQIKTQEGKKKELQYLIDQAVKTNDEANGANYAEELSTLESDLETNNQQLATLNDSYKQNTEIIAESIRQIQKMQREFETLKAQVAVSRNMEGLATMYKSSITELQGMMGGEGASAMQRMRVAAVQGQAQMTSTMDLAKEMGSGIRQQQEARKAKGKALFAEYKAKSAVNVQPTEVKTDTTEVKQTERATISVNA